LPVPEQIWKEVSTDFMTGLPDSDGCTNLIVVTGCLSKDVVLMGLEDITAESVAKVYINYVVVSDYRAFWLGFALSQVVQAYSAMSEYNSEVRWAVTEDNTHHHHNNHYFISHGLTRLQSDKLHITGCQTTSHLIEVYSL
jgi:hypothetical protein